MLEVTNIASDKLLIIKIVLLSLGREGCFGESFEESASFRKKFELKSVCIYEVLTDANSSCASNLPFSVVKCERTGNWSPRISR